MTGSFDQARFSYSLHLSSVSRLRELNSKSRPACVLPSEGAEGKVRTPGGNARGRRGASSLPGSNAFARLSFLWETVPFTKMLRVVSWNINGIRSPLQGLACQEPSSCPTALRRVLDELDADIVCLQETKVTSEHSRIQDLYGVFLLMLTFVLSHFAFRFPILRILPLYPSERPDPFLPKEPHPS